MSKSRNKSSEKTDAYPEQVAKEQLLRRGAVGGCIRRAPDLVKRLFADLRQIAIIGGSPRFRAHPSQGRLRDGGGNQAPGVPDCDDPSHRPWPPRGLSPPRRPAADTSKFSNYSREIKTEGILDRRRNHRHFGRKANAREPGFPIRPGEGRRGTHALDADGRRRIHHCVRIHVDAAHRQSGGSQRQDRPSRNRSRIRHPVTARQFP